MTFRRDLLRAAAAGALLLAVGIAGDARAADPIKVGTIFPLSGGAGPNGQAVTDAVKVAAKMINEQGGLLGRQITVVSKDDESTPAVGVSRANEMIAEKVDVVIEGWNSPVTLAMQPVLARAGVLDITAVSKADPIVSGQGNPYAIRTNSSNGQDGAILAKYIVETLGAKRIGFLTQNDAYGNGAQQIIEAEMKKLGKPFEVVVVEQFPFKQTDFRVQLANVAAANPDAVVAINASESSGMPALIQQYRQAGIKGTLIGAVGTILPTVFKVAGAALDGVVSADIYFPDQPPFDSIPENAAFVKAYKEVHGEIPDKGAALGALALQVWAKAVAKTNSLDRKTVAEAIRGKTIEGTLFGTVSFAENGQSQLEHALFKVTDGTAMKLEMLQ